MPQATDGNDMTPTKLRLEDDGIVVAKSAKSFGRRPRRPAAPAAPAAVESSKLHRLTDVLSTTSVDTPTLKATTRGRPKKRNASRVAAASTSSTHRRRRAPASATPPPAVTVASDAKPAKQAPKSSSKGSTKSHASRMPTAGEKNIRPKMAAARDPLLAGRNETATASRGRRLKKSAPGKELNNTKTVTTTSTPERGVVESLTITTEPDNKKEKSRKTQKGQTGRGAVDAKQNPALEPFAWYKEDRVAREIEDIRAATRDRYELIYMLAVLHQREIIEGRLGDDFVKYNISDPKFPELYRNITQGIHPPPKKPTQPISEPIVAVASPSPGRPQNISQVFDDLDDFRISVDQYMKGRPVSQKFVNMTGVDSVSPTKHGQSYQHLKP